MNENSWRVICSYLTKKHMSCSLKKYPIALEEGLLVSTQYFPIIWSCQKRNLRNDWISQGNHGSLKAVIPKR